MPSSYSQLYVALSSKTKSFVTSVLSDIECSLSIWNYVGYLILYLNVILFLVHVYHALKRDSGIRNMFM